ncbi:M28 family metallopeptidase [Anditalea andensis]|uniref:Glutamate carboxypeptidase n=1 Tax=Anditalea andensis TaxID=1048983 RepID=A0A074KYC7_9BACT|nr:M28 family metallopeptidase [Anditalea andensis]KEO73959.1 glutamate carboxypeptidase [Anditalea andensis]
MKNTFFLPLLLGLGTSLQAQQYIGFQQQSVSVQQQSEKRFLDGVDYGRFKTHLTRLTAVPHVAGSAANEKVKDYLIQTMEAAGWSTEVYPYDVYMSKEPGHSAVEIVTPIRKPLNQKEFILEEDPYSDHPDLWKGWNAYSGSGDVTAEVVYANYGTKADFEKLKELGIDVKGKVVLARYGGNFRGYKAKFAEENGAAGLLIYTDPKDSGYAKGLVYPEGIHYNESAIQRGSLLTENFTGDPLTPFEPALPRDGKIKVPRLDPSETALHTIPVTPIPYGAAREIMELMQGIQAVPSSWQGGLPFPYRLEGGKNLKIRVMVDQKRDFVRVHNVIGTLKGSERPDEWIILGCHYDAWGHGATDPNSGTAMLLSLSETLGKLTDKPKRSILIGHWDAEEHGVIGSTEWVEQMRDELKANAVAYINLDAAVSGRNFGAASSPTLKQLIIDSSKEVQFPDSAKSVFEVWAGQKKEPSIGNLGGGSDHIAFYMHVGIPSVSGGTGGPTLYHTNYDNMHFYEKFVDPTFKMGGAVEQLIGLMTLRLANAEVIPYDVPRYAEDLNMHFEQAVKGVKEFHPEFNGFAKTRTALNYLKASSDNYSKNLDNKLDSGLESNILNDINAKLLELEKSFIDPKGMYFGSWYRSLYASTDPYSGYASWMLPGIMYEIENKNTDRLTEWDERYSAAINELNLKVSELNRILEHN